MFVRSMIAALAGAALVLAPVAGSGATATANPAFQYDTSPGGSVDRRNQEIQDFADAVREARHALQESQAQQRR